MRDPKQLTIDELLEIKKRTDSISEKGAVQAEIARRQKSCQHVWGSLGSSSKTIRPDISMAHPERGKSDVRITNNTVYQQCKLCGVIQEAKRDPLTSKLGPWRGSTGP